MNYISAEEFLKQSNNVQKAFVEWWKPTIGDLIQEVNEWDYINNKVYFTPIKIINKDINSKVKTKTIPLLQMQQLVQFIEDKTNSKVIFDYLDTVGGYCIGLILNKQSPTQNIKWFEDLGDDLLQALWHVAIKIVEQEV